MPVPVRNAAFDLLSVPLIRGKRSFRDKRHVDVAMEFALLGYVRHGRNFAAQQLTPKWPADKAERAVMAGLGNAAYLFAQVESTTAGEGLVVKDASGAEGFVRDARFSKTIEPGTAIAGFVYAAGDMLMFSGTPFIMDWRLMGESVTGASKAGRAWRIGMNPTEEERAGQMHFAGSFVAAMLAM